MASCSSSSSSSNKNPPPIPKFSGENFEIWSVKMKTFLKSQDLWQIVKIGYIQPFSISRLTYAEEYQLRENQKKDAKALSYLQQGVSDDVFPRIIGVTKAKQAWEVLHVEFNHENITSGEEEEEDDKKAMQRNDAIAPYAYGYPMPTTNTNPYNQGYYSVAPSYGYGPRYPMAYHPHHHHKAYKKPAFPNSSQYRRAGGGLITKFAGNKMKQVLNTIETNLGGPKNINQPMATMCLPNSGAIIGPNFVSQYPLDLKITRKIFTVSEGNFSVTDMKGNSLFSVQGKFWTLHDRRTLLDSYGNPLVNFHQKTISLHDRWVAYRGESTRSQDKLFMAKRGSLVRLKKTLKVFLATSRKGDSCDFKIKGSWFDKSFIIYTGKTNIVVAEMHDKPSVQSLVLDKDTFILTVHPNIDYAFIVSLLVMFDGILQEYKDDGLVNIF